MLSPGTRLGPYEILSLLGAGGMGEVYKGRDVRLDRLVALKLLAPHLTNHAAARDRFEREAKTVANLKHAHICVLYDIGTQELEEAEETREAKEAKEAEVQVPRGVYPESREGRRTQTVHFLVLEYLEGETLAERLKRGPLPLAEALQYAVEIADALDQAHRAGVTHRDIKPGNIMLVPSTSPSSTALPSTATPARAGGTRAKTETKLLDFGLAKLKQEVANATLPASERPTIPGGALTQDGTILGTLHYMAPEQLESKDVDGRADIFSFGAVVHEMVTGKKAFPGETQASIIAKILDHDPPPVSSLEPPGKLSPPALDRIVERCLAKDREDRWQAMRDICHELQWVQSGAKQSTAEVAEAGQARMPVPPAKSWRRVMPWGVAAVFFVGFLALLVPAVRDFLNPAEETAPVRFSVETQVVSYSADTAVGISPDGRHLVFRAPFNGLSHLWVRPLDSVTAQPLQGTAGATELFWSPDSRSLAFMTGTSLRKIEVSGGSPQTIINIPNTDGGTWNREGVILLGAATGLGISRVSAAGGEMVTVTTPDSSRGEFIHRLPFFLPDGRHFLYTVQGQPEAQGIYVGSLDSEEGKRLLPDFSMARYAAPGYLLFVRQGTLMAQPFDATRLELSGEAFPIAEQVSMNLTTGFGAFSVSDSGVLAYQSAGESPATQLAWFDRAGRELGTVGPPGAYLNPKLSPDGRRVAVEQLTSNNRDIWILEVERGVPSRFTFDAAEEISPLWSADGQYIAYVSTRSSPRSLYQKPSSGAGTEEVLLQGGVGSMIHDWSPDGRFITYRPVEGVVIWALPLDGDKKPIPLSQTAFLERQSQVSPDGKWLAYISNESGRDEIYVQTFPEPRGKWQVSNSGGVQPRWNRNGGELFYISLDGNLMTVPVRGNGTLEVGAPQALFEVRTVEGATTGPGLQQQYDVSPDGQRFLMNVTPEAASTSPITVVLNWFEELRRRVPAR